MNFTRPCLWAACCGGLALLAAADTNGVSQASEEALAAKETTSAASTGAANTSWEDVRRIRTEAFELTYASAVEVAEMINSMWKGNTTSDWSVSRVAAALPDVNVVAITAPQGIMEACRKIIQRVDQKPKQVYVEARFVELTNKAEHDLGVHWGLLQEFGVTKASASAEYTHTENRKQATTENTTFKGTLTSTEVSLLLSALEGSEDVKTFQNPKVIVTSGRRATVDMTTKRPNAVVAAKRVINGNNNTLDVDMKMQAIPGSDKLMFAGESFFSWGVELEVSPRVLTNGLINVKIIPTISSCEDYVTVDSGDADDQANKIPYSKFPILNLQRIVSEFTMKSGMTAVIGGLSRTEEVEDDTGIPWLEDIPWIGNKLFGYRSRVKEQKEIIVFVTMGLADPEELPQDAGMPKNAILGKQYTNGMLKEPGDRTDAVKGVRSLDLRDLDAREH